MHLKGLGVSPGIGIGRALVLKRSTRELRFRVPPALVPRELERLELARTRSREQIEQIKKRIADSAGADHVYLFDAQLLMLDDPMLIDRAASIIREERLNAESALQRSLQQISAVFDRAEDSYLRERKGDVADVVGRLCMNLRTAGDAADPFKGLEEPMVLVADEVTPSVIAQLDWSMLAALVTDAGSWTYHTAILARSLHIPAVAGLHNASAVICAGRERGGGRLVRRGHRRSRRAGAGAGHRQAAPPRSLRTVARRIPRAAGGHARTASASGSRPTSKRPTMRRGPRNAAPKASGCSDRSSCWPAGARGRSPRRSQYAAYRRLIEGAGGRG